MVLRIASQSGEATPVQLKLEADITGEWVALLQEECRRHLAPRDTLELDLVGVAFVDRAGVAMVRGASGVRLVGTSPLVDARLGPEGGS